MDKRGPSGRPTAILGIDAGTTAVKSVVVAVDGRVLGSARSTVRIRRPHPQHAEQDMDEVWAAVSATVNAALAEAGDVELIGAGVTGQGDGAWLVDAAGRPVGPALLWLDGRAADRVAAWESGQQGALVRRITGAALFPGALPVLLEELDPELVARAATQLNCKDWIRYRLTGQLATDPSEASRTYLDTGTGEYSTELLSGLGHERFSRLLPPVLQPSQIAGQVSERAARETGLPVGLPVVTGLVDTAAGGYGLGVTQPGEVYLILGTTAFVGSLHEARTAALDIPVITLNLGREGGVVECLAPMNGTPNLDWAREALGQTTVEWSQVEELASQAPAGAGGVLYLPYAGVSGERAPFIDASASASWLGLTVRTTPGEMLRAVYEGIALSMRECMQTLDVEPDCAVRLCGGGARSAVVCQIIADVTGRQVLRATTEELGVRGVAALVLVGTGHAPDIDSALAAFTDQSERFTPNPALRPVHDRQARAFTAIRDAIRPHWPLLRLPEPAVPAAPPGAPIYPVQSAGGTMSDTPESTTELPLLVITASFDPTVATRLAKHFQVETVKPSMDGHPLADRGLDDQLARATAVICETDVVDRATLAKAPHLRVVVSCRASPVNVDIDACAERSIAVITTPARNADVTADLAFTLLLMTVRHTGLAERWLRSGAWSPEDVFEPYSTFRGIGLNGRTLGILGGGAIGRRMMQRARAFGMHVLVYDPYLPADAFNGEAEITELDEVLSRSDVVTVHVPLAESTIGLIGDRELRLMRRDAYLINAGRAAVVEEDALVNALTEHRLAGAGLDVFWTEPVPADHPLFAMDNVTLTPHIGGASDDVIVEHSRIAERGLHAWLTGEGSDIFNAFDATGRSR